MTAGMVFDAGRGLIRPLRWLLAWVCLIGVSALTGVLVAVLPTGVLIRVLIVPTAFALLAVCWMLRRPNARTPGRGIFFLLLATVGFSVLWPRYIFFSLGGPYVSPQTLSVIASVGAVVLWSVYSPAFSGKLFSVVFRSGGIGLLIVLWFVWRLIASALGEFPVASVLDCLRDMVYVSSFFLVGCALSTYEDGPRWMLRVVVATGFLVATAGLMEAFLQRNLFIQFASGGDSQAVADALKTITLDKTRDGIYRAQSTFDHPIVFAQFVAAVIPLAAYVVAFERHWVWRLIGVLVIPVGVLAIVKSGSRSGIVSMAVAFSFMGAGVWLRSITSKGFGKVFALAALPVLIFGLAVGYFVVQELVLGRSSSEAGSSSVRMKMVLDSMAALNESPLWGFGHGLALFKAGVISGHTGVATLDSLVLTYALDYGYIGLLLFLSVVFVFAFRSGLASIRLRGEDGVMLGMLVASVLALFATFAGLSIGNNMTLLWLLIAISLPSIQKARDRSPRFV